MRKFVPWALHQNSQGRRAGIVIQNTFVGEQYLRDFQDNEKTIPTILTTSQKLSTGVDARNSRNIVLMRPVGMMIEFQQIIGRGTRLFDGKKYCTISSRAIRIYPMPCRH